MRYAKVADLVTREPFSTLFPIDPKVLAAIQEKMRDDGFDESKVIDVWEGENVVVDGHTRLAAAVAVGIAEVPVFDHGFGDEFAALKYAIGNQRDRRNIDDADQTRCVEGVKFVQHGGDRRSDKTKTPSGVLVPKTNAEVAEIVGISERKVSRIKTVIDYAVPEVKAAVLNGSKSINSAYVETQERRRHTAESVAVLPPPAKARPSPAPVPSPVPAAQSVPLLILSPEPRPAPPKARPQFNETNDMVDWAKWTWNPVTGCEHNCVYCYARDIANRFYPEKFAPTFHPERLAATTATAFPDRKIALLETELRAATGAGDEEGAERLRAEILGKQNVFVCSMADLFGRWVPQEWIDAVLKATHEAPRWNYLYLTKFPLRYEGIEFSENSWVGTSVDEQKRVASAEKAFRKVKAKVKWLSCEPLRERLTFTSLEMFDWVVIGGQSKSTQAPAMQPEWEWVEHLQDQARKAGCKVYWKPNLTVRPREYPVEVAADAAPPPLGRCPRSPPVSELTDDLDDADDYSGHPPAPRELAGKWVAWSRDRRVLVSGDTLAGVMADVEAAGIADASYERLPRLRRYSKE